MNNPDPPDGARFIMLTLESGEEMTGWFDRSFGYRCKDSTKNGQVKSWRELTDAEKDFMEG